MAWERGYRNIAVSNACSEWLSWKAATRPHEDTITEKIIRPGADAPDKLTSNHPRSTVLSLNYKIPDHLLLVEPTALAQTKSRHITGTLNAPQKFEE